MQGSHTSYSHLARAVAALTAALVIGVLPGSTAAAEKTFTFLGGGFGHSVGMSQFGAYGMALDGYTWQEIVTHYFTDTTVVEAAPEIIDPPLWVGLVQEQARVDFEVVATGDGNPASVVVSRGNKTLTASVGDTVTIQHLGDNTCRVTTPAGTLRGSCNIDLEWDGWSAEPATALELVGCRLPNWNAPGGTRYQPCTYARGTMHVRPDNNTQKVDVALEIDIEDYVLGISESPYGWGRYGGMAALQAQAVAARSYALHRALDRGDPADRNWCWCHLYDTSIDQVYVGWGHGTQEWIDAVETTTHMIGTHASETYRGAPMPIEAFYSSSTFGWTENSEHGFTAYVPYLRSVDDHWSQMEEVHNGNARWTREFSDSQLAAALPGVSSVDDVDITACSSTGAALEITFRGGHGSKAFGTRELRGLLGLRSMQVYNAGSPPPADPPCPQPNPGGGGGAQDPPPQPPAAGPVTLVGLAIDDDDDGDSQGNGNAIAECGETVEVFTTILNQGGRLSSMGSTLSTDDPYVSVRWNTSSTFPDMGPGAESVNRDDWDLTIPANTPGGHRAELVLRVDADEAGPWDLAVTLPVTCNTIDARASVAIGDLDHNRVPELVTAYQASNGRPSLSVRDSATGRQVASLAIAPAGYQIVDLEPMPDDDASVAVLIRRGSDGKAKVVVADLRREEKTHKIRFGKRDVVALVVISDVGGQTGFAVAEQHRNGRARVIVRGTDSKPVAKVGLALTLIDLEPLDDLGSGSTAELAVLGTRRNDKAVAIVFDPKRRERLGIVGFGGGASPIDLETFRDGPGGPVRKMAVARTREEGTRVTVVDALNGRDRVHLQVPISTPVDLEAVSELGGGDRDAVAVLGLAPDGAASAIVADPDPGRLMSGPVFAADALPIDLTVVPGIGQSRAALASLGSRSADEAVISLRDAGSGASLGEIPVP